jgi:hypothetical protein
MKCSSCGAISDRKTERYWRLVTVNIAAVPPRVASTKKLIREILCPMCASEADAQLNPVKPAEGEPNVQ